MRSLRLLNVVPELTDNLMPLLCVPVVKIPALAEIILLQAVSFLVQIHRSACLNVKRNLRRTQIPVIQTSSTPHPYIQRKLREQKLVLTIPKVMDHILGITRPPQSNPKMRLGSMLKSRRKDIAYVRSLQLTLSSCRCVTSASHVV